MGLIFGKDWDIRDSPLQNNHHEITDVAARRCDDGCRANTSRSRPPATAFISAVHSCGRWYCYNSARRVDWSLRRCRQIYVCDIIINWTSFRTKLSRACRADRSCNCANLALSASKPCPVTVSRLVVSRSRSAIHKVSELAVLHRRDTPTCVLAPWRTIGKAGAGPSGAVRLTRE